MNPHRERNHGSIEHRESIKRMLQKTNVENRKRALRGQLQKMAVRFTSSFGPDWDAIDAFKGKQKYTSKSKKFESTGNELKLNGHIVARHHKDGIEVSNAGHDTNKTYSTIKGLGIHARNQKGITKLNNKVIDVNSGEFVLVPHKEISGKPITYTKPTSRKSRSVSKQSIFRDLVEKKESAAQGRKGKLPLSQINIQPEDQKQINKLTGVKSPIGKEILGVEAHHIFSHKKNKGLTSNPNNGIMIPKADHKLLTSFAKLQSRLQKIAAVNSSILGNNYMENEKTVHNSFMKSKDRIKQTGGWTYDHKTDRFYDASNIDDALELRKIHRTPSNLNLGFNSITDDDKGKLPLTDTNELLKQLKSVKEMGKDPIIGGYNNGLNAGYTLSGTDKDILNDLDPKQESSLSISPDGTSRLLYPDGRKEILTKSE